VLRTDFEDIIIQHTPYYESLDQMNRDRASFNKYFGILHTLARNDGLVNAFHQRGGKEMVFLGRKIFVLQNEFVTSYLKFLQDESHSTKWEEFFDRYSKSLFDIYERFTQGDPFKIVIFEIVNRKLLRDLLTKYTTSVPYDIKVSALERFGSVVNQLFNYVRNSLTRNVIIPDSLIVNSYEKIPLMPRCSRSEALKLLSKQLLQRGMPEVLFNAIFKAVTTSYYSEQKSKVLFDLEHKEHLNQAVIKEIFNSGYFFPDEKTAEEVLALIRRRTQAMSEANTAKKTAVESKIKELESKIDKRLKESTVDLTRSVRDFSTEEALDGRVQNLKREMLSFAYSLKNLRRELQDYQLRETEFDGLIRLRSSDLSKFITKNDWDPFIILLLNKYKPIDDETMQVIIKEVGGEIKGDKNAMTIVSSLKIPGFLKDKYNTTEINKRFIMVLDEIILPLIQSFLLEELIEYYPKITGTVSQETVRHLAEEAMAGQVSMIEKDIEQTPRPEEAPALNIEHYKKQISVLVYDIRGSTFMGTKLQDARKENEIRNLFQESMLATIEKYGGIPIKDTGDGGIALFTQNHYEITNGKTTELEPGSAVSTMRCALEMTQGARRFIEENITRYKDWFKTAEERKIDFEGATYATLPPSYQAIFQIGVGIASGTYPREVFLDRNAFGELDLTGMLVREASFYCKVKAKDKSTVICDDSTVYNLLLNIEKFSFLGDSELKTNLLNLDIEQGLEYWINQRTTRRGFILDLYRIFATNLGQEVCHPGSLKILLGIDDIAIDETGEIKDGKGGRGKFLFELSQEVPK